MKKNIIGLAGCMFMFAACDESKYDLENLVPDEYHTIVYMQNNGDKELTLYDVNDENFTYTHSMYFVKSGSEPESEASVELKVMSEEVVNSEYGINNNITYKVLPDNCYKLVNPSLKFTSEDRVLEANVELIPTKIRDVQDNDTEDVVWVLPLEVVSETDSVNSEKNRSILLVNEVIPASVEFTDPYPSVLEFVYRESNVFVQKVSIGLNTDNKWNLNCSLGIDESYISTYNQENGTNFILLDPSYYTLPASVEISETSSTADVEINVDPTELNPGEYMIPVKIESTSLFEHSETVYPLAIRVINKELDRTGWNAFASSTEWNDEWWNDPNGIGIAREARNVLDGDLSTFWHTRWTQKEENDNLPFYLVIDTQKENIITRIEMIQRYYDSEGDTKDGIFFVTSNEVGEGDLNSENESCWTQAGTFNMKQYSVNQQEYQAFDISPIQGRYIIIKMTDSYRDVCSLSEVRVYGTEASE